MNRDELKERLAAEAAALDAKIAEWLGNELEITPLPEMCSRCLITVQDGFNPGCPHGGHERAGDSPLNLKLLDAALEGVESARKLLRDGEGNHRLVGGAHGPAWAQMTWRDALVNVGVDEVDGDDADVPRCGTAMCLAGWADTVDALPGERLWLVTDEQLNDQYLDLEDAAAIMLVARADDDQHEVLANWIAAPDESRLEHVIEANVRARRLLGLNRVQLLLRSSKWGRTARRELSDEARQDWQTGIHEIFDGGNHLETLHAYRDDLVKLNDWLLAHRSEWYDGYPE